MSVSLKPLTVDEFLAWERAQPARYEFDGIQPVAMTGGSRLHARMIARLTLERFQPDWKRFNSNFASNFIDLTLLRYFQSA